MKSFWNFDEFIEVSFLVCKLHIVTWPSQWRQQSSSIHKRYHWYKFRVHTVSTSWDSKGGRSGGGKCTSPPCHPRPVRFHIDSYINGTNKTVLGIAFSATWWAPENKAFCQKNAICELIFEKAPDSQIEISAEYENKILQITGTFTGSIPLVRDSETVILSFEQAQLQLKTGTKGFIKGFIVSNGVQKWNRKDTITIPRLSIERSNSQRWFGR